MWVRSQNKEKLLKVTDLRLCILGVYYQIRDNGTHLGSYSTKEKALKVLDMIEEHLSAKIVEFDLNGQVKYEYYKADCVFQMPQDEEV